MVRAEHQPSNGGLRLGTRNCSRLTAPRSTPSRNATRREHKPYAEQRAAIKEAQSKLRAQAEREVVEEMHQQFREGEDRLRPLLRGPKRNDALLQHARTLSEAFAVRIVADPLLDNTGKAYVKSGDILLPANGAFDDVAYARSMHEIGHHLAEAAEPCDGRGLHYRSPEKDRRGCLRCERNAWVVAVLLAVEWSATMHARMRFCLSTYTDVTPGPAAMTKEIADLCSRATFVARAARQRREEKLAKLLQQQRTQEALR